MCEICKQAHCLSKCPNADEPKFVDTCDRCSEELREDYTYWTDVDGHKFCSEDCAIEYYQIEEAEWRN